MRRRTHQPPFDACILGRIVTPAWRERKWQLAPPRAKGRILAAMAFDPTVDRNADLRVWRAQFPGTTPIRETEPRQRQTCVGVVAKIRLVPSRQLEITLEDGSGRLTAIFSGRSNLPGLELGGGLRVTGTIASDNDGALHMRNPSWATVAEPYA